MTGPQIATLYGVDKSMAAGWLISAKIKLRSRTLAAKKRSVTNGKVGRNKINEVSMYSGVDTIW